MYMPPYIIISSPPMLLVLVSSRGR
jgi:hypothetical protein